MNEKSSNPFRYTVSARPTMYSGTKYRSELEASWACFFDIRGIHFEFEPALDLLSWKPDFLIRIQDSFELAEVKPFISEKQWKESGTLKKINESLQGSTLAILLGVSPLTPSNFIFRITSVHGLENPEFEELNFGPADDVKRDWARAKNTVQWRPNGTQ